jgi:hypothetical protein
MCGADQQARWAPSPRAQRLACHRHERARERVGVRGAFVLAIAPPAHARPRRSPMRKKQHQARRMLHFDDFRT